MNGIEKITEKLLAEANARADAVLRDADAQCEAIKADYAARAQREYDSAIDSGRKALAAVSGQMESAAEQESRKQLLALKQEMVSEAFLLASEKIASLPMEQYVNFLAHQAVEASGDGEGILLMNQDDRTRVGQTVTDTANALLRSRGMPGNLVCGEETRPIRAGIILKKGDIEVNCSVETLTALCRSEMAVKVAHTLFD